MTNTVPTAPFRGAGRPEATAVMERLHRHRGATAEDRPGEAAAAQSDPARQAASSHRDRTDLRQRRFRRQPGARARMRGLERLSGPPQGGKEARPAARHRRRQLCRDPGGHAARARGGQRVVRRQRRSRRRNAVERAGPRDKLPAGHGRSARRPAGRDQFRQRRQCDARLRRRNPFRSLHASCRFADGGDVAHRDRQGAPDRSRHARGCRRRHFVRRRTVHGAQQQPASHLVRYCPCHR